MQPECFTIHEPFPEEDLMLRLAIAFFIIALIAAIFGFGGISAAAVDIGQVLFFIFLVLFVLALIVGLASKPK